MKTQRINRQNGERNLTFHRDENSSRSYRLLLWMLLTLGGVWLLLQIERGEVEPLFQPTPTPTRTAASHLLEAETHFQAGKIDDPFSENDAIGAYQRALTLDPQNTSVRAEFARILTYSSATLTTTELRRARLTQAREQIEQAVALTPDDSNVQAIYAFVLNWNANPLIAGEQATRLRYEAEQAAVRALQLDPNNTLALAFYAEILIDQQNWAQAEQYARQAVALAPNSMDAHRVYGYVSENFANYNAAIQQYQMAAKITPNLTFLYIYIGLNYRTLAMRAADKTQATPLYEQALDYFDRAAQLNKTLQIQDPVPYIEIAKTYAQQGQFQIAARNAETALEYDPANANTYGQLGSIYVQGRNYEGALPVLKCAVLGCTAEENEVGAVAVQGLPLSSVTVAYYYLRYASVLAAQNNCEQAYPILEQLLQTYGNDAVIPAIVRENYAICGQTPP